MEIEIVVDGITYNGKIDAILNQINDETLLELENQDLSVEELQSALDNLDSKLEQVLFDAQPKLLENFVEVYEVDNRIETEKKTGSSSVQRK